MNRTNYIKEAIAMTDENAMVPKKEPEPTKRRKSVQIQLTFTADTVEEATEVFGKVSDAIRDYPDIQNTVIIQDVKPRMGGFPFGGM